MSQESSGSKPFKVFNGPAILIAMLRELDPVSRRKFQSKIEEASPVLSRLVDHCEFLYIDLIWLENKNMQTLLSQIPETQWLLAWKMTAEPLRAKILQNMSIRRQKNFLLDAGNAPKVHKKNVIKAQKEIACECLERLRTGEFSMASRRYL